FAELYTQLQRAVGATHRVLELLREEPEDAAAELPGSPARIAGDVAFEGVTFAYPSRKEVTGLREWSLGARAGQRVALAGPGRGGRASPRSGRCWCATTTPTAAGC